MTITRQDLEDAALAQGNIATDGIGGRYNMEQETNWNPLANKADLWDLADKCGMTIAFKAGIVWTDEGVREDFHPHNHAECAEAVVLAAAEIWRAKK